MGDCFSCLRRPLPLPPPRPPPPSTDTDTDLKSFLHNLNDISQLNDLIKFIEDLLKIASGEKTRAESSSALSSYIQDGEKFMEMVEKHVDKQKEKKEILSDISAEMEKVVMDLLKGVGKIHWVGAALSVLGFVLDRYGQMSSNQRECLALLKDMFNLGKHILHLNDQMVEQKQKLNEAVQCIVVGCTMCISQFTTAKIFRFLTASVNAESLKGFQTKIDRLYSDLTLWGITDIGKKLPKIAPQSQEIYTYQNRVGIESGRERVIQLLDLNAQDASSRVVVVFGFGGIGKTTLTDAVYAHIDLIKYNHCRIHMDENRNKRELKDLQEQISQGLFQENVKFTDCDQGRGMLSGFFRKRANQPLFIYIDNALKQTDIRQLLPEDLKDCLPQRSRILVTTRNLHETNIFLSSIPRREYIVSPLPDAEAKKLLLTKAFDCENNIETLQQLLKLCGGIPLVLEIIGSQLRWTSVSNMILDLLRQGEKVEEGEISSRMVDFVYNKLEQPVKEAFLDIASFFCNWESKEVAYIIGEEVFTALEEASFIKTSEEGNVIVHDIVCARGQKLSKQTRITDTQSLMDCLEDKEKLKTLKGIVISLQDDSSPIKVKEDHLNWMSKSLRHFDTRGKIFSGKSRNPFKELRYLRINGDIPYLPIVFDKLEHLAVYKGKFMQGISLYEFPASLRSMDICRQSSSWNSEAYCKTPPKVTPDSSLVKLNLVSLENIERLPDGIHQLTKLQVLD